MSKKVLIVCYYWPPAGGPGVQRWLKFVKYLPQFGIEPFVYVPENPSYPLLDKTLVSEIPQGITVLKQPIREPYRFASAFSRKQTQTISAGIVPKEEKQSLMQKLMLFVRGNFFIPDARVRWVKPSVGFLTKYIEEHQIDTIVTTGPPHSLHLIGLQLKKVGGLKQEIKWFADFRDPWTTIGYHNKLKMTSKTKAKHKALEKEVLETADHLIVTSPGTKREFSAITDRPISIITNGFDDVVIEDVKADTTFTIAHIGSLLSDRNPLLLWKAFGELVTENPTFKKHFRLKLAGKVSQDVIESIHEAGLESYLEVLGYVSHKEALVLQQKATVLLLIEIDKPETRAIIPGKLFEYMSAKKPVLALGPQGADIEKIIADTQVGCFVGYENIKYTKELIVNYLNDFISSNGSIESLDIDKYHRRQLTEQLSEILTKN